MLIQPKKYILFFLIFLLFFSVLVWATVPEEEDEDDPVGIKSFMIKKRVNAAYVIIGAGSLRIKSLNDFLGTNGLPEVTNNFLSFGLGGHIIHNKMVIGLELGRYLEHYGPSKLAYNTSLSARYTVINFGYLFQSESGLMYYPFIGLGAGLLKLQVVENNIDHFGDVMKGQDGSDAKRLSMLLNVGVSLDYFHKYNKKKKGKNSLVFGLRAGYLFSPLSFDWKVNRIAVPSGPGTTINGPYFRVVIGLGGWIETLIKQAI